MDISLLLLFLWLSGAEVENTAADKTFFQFPNPLNKFVVCRILLVTWRPTKVRQSNKDKMQ